MSTLSDLNGDLFEEIFKHLDMKDVFNLTATCKEVRAIIAEMNWFWYKPYRDKFMKHERYGKLDGHYFKEKKDVYGCDCGIWTTKIYYHRKEDTHNFNRRKTVSHLKPTFTERPEQMPDQIHQKIEILRAGIENFDEKYKVELKKYYVNKGKKFDRIRKYYWDYEKKYLYQISPDFSKYNFTIHVENMERFGYKCDNEYHLNGTLDVKHQYNPKKSYFYWYRRKSWQYAKKKYSKKKVRYSGYDGIVKEHNEEIRRLEDEIAELRDKLKDLKQFKEKCEWMDDYEVLKY